MANLCDSEDDVGLLTEMAMEEGIGEQISQALKKQAEDVLAYFISKQEEWKTTPLNIAVIGASGVGKSTFINTMRGLKASDFGAAPVGSTHTTFQAMSYPHPHNPMLVFWDLPGVGTQRFPQETYLQMIDVDRYDCFMIMTSTRVCQTDVWLGKELKKRKKYFYFVRSKVDFDVMNDRYETGANHDLATVLRVIRENIAACLKQERNFEVNVFLVDSHKRDKYDFYELERRMVEDLPRHKRNAMLLSLLSHSVSMIQG